MGDPHEECGLWRYECVRWSCPCVWKDELCCVSSVVVLSVACIMYVVLIEVFLLLCWYFRCIKLKQLAVIVFSAFPIVNTHAHKMSYSCGRFQLLLLGVVSIWFSRTWFQFTSLQILLQLKSLSFSLDALQMKLTLLFHTGNYRSRKLNIFFNLKRTDPKQCQSKKKSIYTWPLVIVRAPLVLIDPTGF